MTRLKFIDLFAGIGGFHVALSSLGHECVFASEIDDELRGLYLRNFPNMNGKVFGDIRESKGLVPAHDFLCAGFPCQPFSKSGDQLGTKDETRGTLFREILDILEVRRPRYVLLENVGNFGRHDEGKTWKIVKQRLTSLGYDVCGTEHVTPISDSDWRDVGRPMLEPVQQPKRKKIAPGEIGHGLISPHHFGFPHHRERFYIFATLGKLSKRPFPIAKSEGQTSLNDIVQLQSELTEVDIAETALSAQQVQCIDHWNKLICALPKEIEPPSFPLWGDELDATYPYKEKTPWATPPNELGQCFSPPFPKYSRKAELLQLLPSYAREEVDEFRHWKIRYIQQNREWWGSVGAIISPQWKSRLLEFPASLRKFEWNVKGETRDVWRHVLQFRPSGLRVKRYSSSPALVAMTATQIPILGPERRFLTRVEGRRLQGFPDNHILPASRDRAFKSLGNAVHVGVIELLARNIVEQSEAPNSTNPTKDLNFAQAA